MTLYALNLFDLADNESYRHYSRRSAGAVGKHGGRVVALGRLDGVQVGDPDVEPRAFIEDPEDADLHPLREEGTRNYLWWLYERLEDLRPLFGAGSPRE